MKKVKVAIIGSGNIGTDLLMKVLKSPLLKCNLFIGQHQSSYGLSKAHDIGIKISDKSINAIIDTPDCCDIVFDATNSSSHSKHALILKELDKFVIDLTPSNIGKMCIPAINLSECLHYQNVSMVTCGGQVAIPLAYAIGNADYIEVISSISSISAGHSTRINIDEYIETTEKGIMSFSGCKKAKAILNINPSIPYVDMKTTLLIKTDKDIDTLRNSINKIVSEVQKYIPGYQIIVNPTVDDNKIVIMVKVSGQCNYLPSYAGNLDVINCAAICMAEEYAKNLDF